jgi:hypothetical protein
MGRRGYKGHYVGKQGQVILMETVSPRKDKHSMRERRKNKRTKGINRPQKG